MRLANLLRVVVSAALPILACGASSPEVLGLESDASSAAQNAGDGSAQQLCVDTINAYRATLGLSPLARWKSNESCVDGEAKSDMASKVAHGAFGTCLGGKGGAQNECPGYPMPIEQSLKGCLAQMWNEGPGTGTAHSHYTNMTNKNYTKVACGFAISADGKTFWATQDFQ